MTMFHDYTDKAVLITGGTRGIGLATGLAFGRRGAHVHLTHRWGSADEGEIKRAFADAGAPEPTIIEADVARKEDTKKVMETLKERHDGVEMFLSNVAVVQRGTGLDDMKKRSLHKSLEFSTWPIVTYTQAIHKTFGRYPKYIVASSSDGPDNHFPAYDFVAISKAVLETLVRYLATHLRAEGVKVNALRTRMVLTEAYTEIFGEENVHLAKQFEDFAITTEEVANATYAMCSGLMDSFSGQVLTLDKGASFVDNIMTLGSRLSVPKSEEASS